MLGSHGKKADLEAKIATAEKVADLSKRIEATQRIIDSKRTEAAKVEFKSSAATNHNDTLFKAINMVTSGVFKQSVSMDEREATNTGIMGISSIAFLLLAPLFYFAAGLNRRANVMDEWMPTGINVKGLSLKNANLGTLHAAPTKPETLVMEKVINNHIDDRMALKNIQAALRDVFGAPQPHECHQSTPQHPQAIRQCLWSAASHPGSASSPDAVPSPSRRFYLPPVSRDRTPAHGDCVPAVLI